jgi:hypothetical protein
MTIAYVLVGFACANIGFFGFTKANSNLGVRFDGQWGGLVVDRVVRIFFSFVCAAAGMGLLYAAGLENIRDVFVKVATRNPMDVSCDTFGETCWNVSITVAAGVVWASAFMGLGYLLFQWFKMVERWALR